MKTVFKDLIKRVYEEGEENVIRRTPRETPVNGNKKVAVVPHRKRNVARSQNQALPKITKGMEDLAGAQTKRTKLMIEAGKKRDELFLKHKADESQQTCENIKPKKPVKTESMS